LPHVRALAFIQERVAARETLEQGVRGAQTIEGIVVISRQLAAT